MGKVELTQKRLKDLLFYNPKLGVFIRKKHTSNRVKVGEVAGSIDFYGYIIIGICGRSYKAHRLAFLYMDGKFPPGEVDHINGVTSDNSWENIRPATSSENSRNQKLHSNNTSGVMGVYFHRSKNKWYAAITVNTKNIHLGSFSDINDAIKVRKAAEIEYGFHPNHGKTAMIKARQESGAND